MKVSLPIAVEAWMRSAVVMVLALTVWPQIAAGQCGTMIQPPATVLQVANRISSPTDHLRIQGDFVMPASTFAALDPITNGATIEVEDGSVPPTVVFNVALPPGAYDSMSRIGWTLNDGGNRWLFRNNNAGAPETNGIRRLILIDRSQDQANQVRLRVMGIHGEYPVEDTIVQPFKATVSVDTTCGETNFASTDCRSHASHTVNAVLCKIGDLPP